MRSAVIWNEFSEGLRFFVIDTDMTKYQDVFINSCEENEVLQQALSSIMYHEDTGESRVQFCDLTTFQHAVRGGATIVHCGFLP